MTQAHTLRALHVRGFLRLVPIMLCHAVSQGDGSVQSFLTRQTVMILDGGLATELEARGCDLNDDLWSAKVLLEEDHLIRQVHRDYLDAGADCIASSSYQATLRGFERRGATRQEAIDLLERSVRIAVEERNAFWRDPDRRGSRLAPLVAASIGPYGAFLADGSEYTGAYDLDSNGLYEFHRERWHILAGSGPDVIACETIPSSVEAKTLTRLMLEIPAMPAWVSFSCRDGSHLSDGTPIGDAVRLVAPLEQVVAVGVNCVAPSHVLELIGRVRAVTDKPIVVYPNSGETFDPTSKRWIGVAAPTDFGRAAQAWVHAGARLVGGCCRTGPSHIQEIRTILLGHP